MRKTAKLSEEDHKFLKVLAAESGTKTIETLLVEAVELLRKKYKRARP